MVLVFVLTAFLSLPAQRRSFLRTAITIGFPCQWTPMIKFKYSDAGYCNFLKYLTLLMCFSKCCNYFSIDLSFKKKKTPKKPQLFISFKHNSLYSKVCDLQMEKPSIREENVAITWWEKLRRGKWEVGWPFPWRRGLGGKKPLMKPHWVICLSAFFSTFVLLCGGGIKYFWNLSCFRNHFTFSNLMFSLSLFKFM